MPHDQPTFIATIAELERVAEFLKLAAEKQPEISAALLKASEYLREEVERKRSADTVRRHEWRVEDMA